MRLIIVPKSLFRWLTNLILFSLCISMVVYTAELMSEPKMAAIYGEFDFQNLPTLTQRLLRVRRNSNSEDVAQVIAETKSLLLQGKTEISIHQDIKEITMVMGMTGSGKTTLTQLLSGDNASLKAYNVSKSTFLIKDDRNRISTDTLVSKSIFPELVVDNETNSALYDCPGFKDTRKVSVEIANTFFMKNVTDHASKLKILLIVDHNSLQKGQSREGFKNLILNMRMFLKDVSRYSNNLALVASKVYLPQESDDDIVSGIADFLESAKEEFNQTAYSEYASYANAFIDIFLQQDDAGQHPRIGFFRQPDRSGILSANPKVQANRHKLRDMVFHNRFFTYQDSVPSDFGYAISDAALNKMNELVNVMIMDAAKAADRYKGQFSDAYVHKMNLLQDFKQIVNNTIHDLAYFTCAKRNLDELLTSLPVDKNVLLDGKILASALASVRNVNVNVNVTLQLNELDEFLRLHDFISFFETMTEIKKGKRGVIRLLEELVKMLPLLSEVVESYKTWYSELSKIQESSIVNGISSDLRTSIQTLNLTRKMEKYGDLLHAIDLEDFYLLKLPEGSFQTLNFSLHPGEDHKLQGLAQILLPLELSPDCQRFNEKNVVISGHIVSISEALACIKRWKTKTALVTTESLILTAYSTIVVDEDFDGREFVDHNGLVVILIAPELRMIATGNALGRNFILDGKPGKNYDKVSDSYGLPGRPGGNGGQLFSFHLRIRGYIHLQSNGGQGGKGQDGATGFSGRDGVNVTLNHLTVDYELGDLDIPDEFDRTNKGCCKNLTWNCPCTVYHVNGTMGKRGHNGSSGGMGGIGAPGGSVFTLAGMDRSYTLQSTPGKNGSSGNPGNRGQGGLNGFGLAVQFYHKPHRGHTYAVYGSMIAGLAGAAAGAAIGSQVPNEGLSMLRVLPPPRPRAPSGNKGNGINKYGLEAPDPNRPATPIFLQSLIQYKVGMRKLMRFEFLRAGLKQFIDQLETDPFIRSSYTIREITKDFYELQKQYFQIRHFVDMLPCYQNLAAKVAALEFHASDSSSRTDEVTPLIEQAHSVILSRYISLSRQLRPSVIFDLEAYLESAVKDIETPSALLSMESLVETTCLLHQDAITGSESASPDSRCPNATERLDKLNQFIRSDIDPEFKKLKNDLLSHLPNLNHSTVSSKIDSELKTATTKILLESLETMRDFIAFLGPAAAFSQFVATVTRISLLTQKPFSSSIFAHNFYQDPGEHLEEHVRAINMRLSENHRKLELMIEDLRNLPLKPKYKHLPKDIQQEFSNRSQNILNLINPRRDECDVSGTSNDHISSLIEQNEQVRDFSQELAVYIKENASPSLLLFIQWFEIFSPNSTTNFTAVANNRKSIGKQADFVLHVSTIKKHLHEEIDTCTEKMAVRLASLLKGSATGKVPSAEEIESEFVSSLRAVRSKISDFAVNVRTTQMDFQQEILHLLQKMESALTSMIALYGDTANFVIRSFMREHRACSIAPEGYEQAKVELDTGVKLGKILTYSEAVHQPFNMWAFPFAHHYLGHLSNYQKLLHEISSDSGSSKDSLDPTNTAKHIRVMLMDMLDAVKRHKTEASEIDTFIHSAEFRGSTSYARWSNKDFSIDIRDLLGGKPVTLKADVVQSPEGREAIKFKTIRLEIVADRPEDQGALMKELQCFRASLTYYGSGYFRYGGRYWTTSCPQFTLSHSFVMSRRGRVDGNNVYDKIARGDAILTPYGTWEIAIVRQSGRDNVNCSFEKLERFENRVDLRLVGEGTFVQERLSDSLLQLEKYYVADDSLG